LTDNASANVSGDGVTVSDTPSLSDDVLSTLLTIDASAEPGAREITVTAPSGTSSPVKFTVVSP
jgi:phosphoribosylpyrophosphate synthetase